MLNDNFGINYWYILCMFCNPISGTQQTPPIFLNLTSLRRRLKTVFYL